MKLLSLLTLIAASYALIIQHPFVQEQALSSVIDKTSVIKTSSTGKQTSWNVLTHSSFPNYKLRLREQEERLCDPNVKQVISLFF